MHTGLGAGHEGCRLFGGQPELSIMGIITTTWLYMDMGGSHLLWMEEILHKLVRIFLTMKF